MAKIGRPSFNAELSSVSELSSAEMQACSVTFCALC